MSTSAASPARAPEPRKSGKGKTVAITIVSLLAASITVGAIGLFRVNYDGERYHASGVSDQTDDFGPIVAAYGPPDTDDSTAYDNPQPPLVTRWVEYKREGLKILMCPTGKLGDPPPYSGWKVVGYISTNEDKAISAMQATSLLQSRDKGR